MYNRHFVTSFFLTSALFLTQSHTYAEQLSADSQLFEIYSLAEKSDPTYLSSEASYLAKKQEHTQSWAAVLPQVNLYAHRTNVDQEVKSSNPLFNYNDDSNNDGYTLTISQALYRQNSFSRVSQANAIVLKAQADFDLAKHDLILRVANSYFDILAAKDALKFNNTEHKALKRRLLQSEQKFEVGLIAITDVHEARSRYDQSTAQVIVAKNGVLIAQEKLRELTGQLHTNIQPLTKEINLLSPQPENITEWITLALKNNLALQAAKQNMLIAKDEVSIQRAGHLPTLDLVAQRSNNNVGGGSFGASETNQTSISLQFNLPLYEGGLTSSKTTQARYSYTAAQQNHIQAKRLAERLVRSAYLNVTAKISQVKALNQAVISSDKALETTQAGYEAGTRTTVDVLNSQRELFRAKKDYSRARYDYLLETLRLKQAAGILTTTDLEKISRWIH